MQRRDIFVYGLEGSDGRGTTAQRKAKANDGKATYAHLELLHAGSRCLVLMESETAYSTTTDGGVENLVAYRARWEMVGQA